MAITGALRTTATDIMEIHANLLPTELLLHRICYRATLRLAALPDTHPLQKKTVKQVAHRDIKHHRSSLHQLLHSYDVQPGTCEVISGGAHPPNKADSFR